MIPSFRNTRGPLWAEFHFEAPAPRLWAVSRAPVIPAALTTAPFSLEDARRHGLTKDHLLGLSWQPLGGGFYALRAIAHDPSVLLAATSRRLPMTAVRLWPRLYCRRHDIT
jgi:hypothetical protein